MSAFIVSNLHINTLLSWANRHEVSAVSLADGSRIDWHQVEDLQRAAEILLAENERAYGTRYAHVSPAAQPAITFNFVPCNLAPVAIIKAGECYHYQACESPDYRASDAARIVEFIQSKAISELPGYGLAAWSIA